MAVMPFIPPECSWLYDALAGQNWPTGDEDALYRCAQAWQDALTQTLELAGYGDSTAEGVGTTIESLSADHFDAFWNQFTQGDNSALISLARQCALQQLALTGQSNEVEYTKLSIDITIVLIAIQIIWALAAAAFTAGGSLAEIPLATFFGQRAVIMLVERFLQMVLMMVLPDVISQGLMLRTGHYSWDGGKTWSAVESGGIAGLLGMVGGAAVAKLPFMGEEFGKTLGGRVVQGLVHFGEGGTVNTVTGITTGLLSGQQLDAAKLWGQFMSGGVLATVFYLPHLAVPHGTPLSFTASDGSRYQVVLNDRALGQFAGNDHQLPNGFTAPVYNESGLKIGTATFDGTTVSLDRMLGGSNTVDLTARGFSLAGHDGSVTSYGFNDQGKPELTSYIQPSDGHVTITAGDGSTVTVPEGSMVHYAADGNQFAADGTPAGGTPYRADIVTGDTVKVWQTATPGQDFQVTGQAVQANPLGLPKFFGLDPAKFYGPDGGDGRLLGTASALTGKTSYADPVGYQQAFGDHYNPAAQNGYTTLGGVPLAPAGAIDPSSPAAVAAGHAIAQDAGTLGTPHATVDGTGSQQEAQDQQDQAAAASVVATTLTVGQIQAAALDGTGQAEFPAARGPAEDPASIIDQLPDRPGQDQPGHAQPPGGAGGGPLAPGLRTPGQDDALLHAGSALHVVDDQGNPVPDWRARLQAEVATYAHDPYARGVMDLAGGKVILPDGTEQDVYWRVSWAPEVNGSTVVVDRFSVYPAPVEIVDGRPEFGGDLSQILQSNLDPADHRAIRSILVQDLEQAGFTDGWIRMSRPTHPERWRWIHLFGNGDRPTFLDPRVAGWSDGPQPPRPGMPQPEPPQPGDPQTEPPPPGGPESGQVPAHPQSEILRALTGQDDASAAGRVFADNAEGMASPGNTPAQQPGGPGAAAAQESANVIDQVPKAWPDGWPTAHTLAANDRHWDMPGAGAGAGADQGARPGHWGNVPPPNFADPMNKYAEYVDQVVPAEWIPNPNYDPTPRNAGPAGSIADALKVEIVRADESGAGHRSAAAAGVEPSADSHGQPGAAETHSAAEAHSAAEGPGDLPAWPGGGPARYAEIQSAVQQGDHLLVEFSDGERTGYLRIDQVAGHLVLNSASEHGALDENGDLLLRMAGSAQEVAGVLKLFGHTDAHGFLVDGMHVPFDGLAERLAGPPGGDTLGGRLAGLLADATEIHLYGCDAGAGDAVAALAAATGRDVVAADTAVWVDKNGNVLASSETVIDGRARPTILPEGTGDGTWKVFHPDGTSEQLARGDPRRPPERIPAPDDELLKLAHLRELGYVGDRFGSRVPESDFAQAIRAFAVGDTAVKIELTPDQMGKWELGNEMPQDPRLAATIGRQNSLNVALHNYAEELYRESAEHIGQETGAAGEPAAASQQQQFKAFLEERRNLAVRPDSHDPQVRFENASKKFQVASAQYEEAKESYKTLRADRAVADKELRDAAAKGVSAEEIKAIKARITAAQHAPRALRSAEAEFEKAEAELKSAEADRNAATERAAGGAPTETAPRRQSAGTLQEMAAMRLNPDLGTRGGPYSQYGEYRLGAPDLRDPNRLIERMDVHGIPVDVSWGEDGKLGNTHVEYPAERTSYQQIQEDVTAYRSSYSVAGDGNALTFDQRYAKAILELMRPGDTGPLESLKALRDLAASTFGAQRVDSFIGAADKNWYSGDVGLFMRRVASVAVLHVELEGARSPSAFLTNLMVWDMVAGGSRSLEDCFGYLNVMGPHGSTEIGKLAHLFDSGTQLTSSDFQGTARTRVSGDLNPGPAPEDLRRRYPEFFQPDGTQKPGALDGIAKAHLMRTIAEFEMRQREILALYAASKDPAALAGSPDAVDALNSFFYGPGGGADANDANVKKAGEAVEELVRELRLSMGWA
jgi:hypothetical protein